MPRYELTYDYANSQVTRHGEVAERVDPHDLLIDLMEAEGKPGRIQGTRTSEESLRLMRHTNVRIRWL